MQARITNVIDKANNGENVLSLEVVQLLQDWLSTIVKILIVY